MKTVLVLLGAAAAVMLVPVALALVSFAAVVSYWTFTRSCEYYTIDALPSPAGRWSVARTERRCTGDENDWPVMFALLPPGAPVQEANVFWTSADYEGTWSALSLFAKWIDDDNLLIAAPEGSTLRTTPNEFKGVHIQYAFYPIDPDKTRDESSRRTIEKKVHFEAEFGLDHGAGVPGIGCHLTVSAHDGEYLDKLSLSMTARTTFAIGSGRGAKTVLHRAYSSYDFQLSARGKAQGPGKNVTGAAVVGFAPRHARSASWTYDLDHPRTEGPSGGPMPKWYFGYTPKSPQDLISIARQAQDGTLAIQAGFWLDNDIVVFSSDEPSNRGAVELFERCIRDNRIFETPRRADR